MTSPKAAEFQRLKNRLAAKRSRLRKAGLLPPLPNCRRCGAVCTNDRWLPFCSLCARILGMDNCADRYRKHPPRAVRRAAEGILLQLRAEARQAAGSVADCDRRTS
jgi:hypothetical protein